MRGKVIKGAFDPRSLSKGHADIIALRRTGMDPGGTAEKELAEAERRLKEKALEATRGDSKVKIMVEQESEEQGAKKKQVVQERMRFVNSASGRGFEKYTTQILQDPPACRGIRFDKRKPPEKIEKEFGKSKKVVANVVPLPPTVFINEDHQEYPNKTGIMGQMCAKSVTPFNPGVLGLKTGMIWKGPPTAPLTAREKDGGSQKWRRAPLSAR